MPEDAPGSRLICEPSLYRVLSMENSNGFAALPDDLLLEVLSYFPPDRVTITAASATQMARREMLRALSEVCQNFRRVYRPCLFQRIEVYGRMRVGPWKLKHNSSILKKHFADELLRQLNIVTIQDPGLAQYVRFVNIEINDAILSPVFDELSRCFSLFPNLHTVKIITMFSTNASSEEAIAAAKHGFKKGILYPQIRSAILSYQVYPLLAVCPNLESLATYKECSHLFQYLKGLTSLRKISCPISLVNVAEVAKELPSLENITICLDNKSNYPTKAYITELIQKISLFTNLKTLVLYRGTFDVPTDSLTQSFLSLPSHHFQNLRAVTFSGYALHTYDREEKVVALA